MGGLLEDALDRVDLELPAAVARFVEETLVRERLWSLKLTAEMVRIQRAFDNASLRVVTLKGVVLAERFYPRPGLRPSGDLDLLVAPIDFDGASEILRGLGYRRPAGESEGVEPDSDGGPHALLFVAEDRAPVELHREASSGFATRIAGAPLMERSKVYRIAAGCEVMVLDRVDETLYLAVHATRHRFYQLRWLWEVAIALRRLEPGEWEEVVARADESGVVRALALAVLTLEHRLEGAGVDLDVLSGVIDARLRLAEGTAYLPTLQRVHPSGPASRAVRLLAFTWYRFLLADRAVDGLGRAAYEVVALARRVRKRFRER